MSLKPYCDSFQTDAFPFFVGYNEQAFVSFLWLVFFVWLRICCFSSYIEITFLSNFPLLFIINFVFMHVPFTYNSTCISVKVKVNVFFCFSAFYVSVFFFVVVFFLNVCNQLCDFFLLLLFFFMLITQIFLHCFLSFPMPQLSPFQHLSVFCVVTDILFNCACSSLLKKCFTTLNFLWHGTFFTYMLER